MSARLDVCVEAFRATEKARLLLDKKERDLLDAIAWLGSEEVPSYVEATEQILREYEEKRDKVRLS